MTKKTRKKPEPANVNPSPEEEAAFLAAQERRINEGQSRAEAIARGTYQVAHVAEVFGRRVFAETPLEDVARAIRRAGDAVAAGDMAGLERMLNGQIVALNAVFVDCAMRAQGNMGSYPETVERYLRIALRSQSQCARTAEVLGNLRAGPTIFAKQANVTTGPQQVNNHAHPTPAARTQEPVNSENELLEDATHELQQRMVPGAQAAPARGNPAVEALGAINRAEDARGKGEGSTQ